ncbi:MAG: hypothetical protein V4485_05170 [Pseudomonadota bacterium]
MFSDLRTYCRWNCPKEVKDLLDDNPGKDITKDDDGLMCIRLAISRDSPEMLDALLKYFRASLPEDRGSEAYNISVHSMLSTFREHVDLEDLSPAMKSVVHAYLPEVMVQGLIDAIANGDTQSVQELYLSTPIAVTQDILEAVTSYEQDTIIDVIAGMADSRRKTSMIFCDTADLYSKSGKLEKAQSFYEKAITADPSHITSYLHLANMIASHLYSTGDFAHGGVEKAEGYYKKVLEYNFKYSCAHKKLGILYQKWSQSDSGNKQELEIKALESYVRAVEFKNPKLQYDALYHEITHLARTNIHHPKVQGIISKSSTYHDSRLQEELASLERVSRQSVVASDITYSANGSEDGGVSSLLDEDIEYEEWDMDRDLDSSNASESGLVGHTDSCVDTI